MLSNGKIALIYFSRSAENEADHKKWSAKSTKYQRINISKFLHNKTLKTLHNSKLDLLRFDENYQKGSNFGENLSSAFDYAFTQGYDAAIAVGNDCLELDNLNIQKVADKLLLGFNALGPTYRNGAYIIGLTKQSFDSEKFAKLSWQTRNLEIDLINYLEDQDQEFYVLNRLRDVNVLHDFSLSIKTFHWQSGIIKSLKNILSFSIFAFAKTIHKLFSTDLFLNVGLRAPPSRF